jgi:hypothetical protein
MSDKAIRAIQECCQRGNLIPYLGPQVLALNASEHQLPESALVLVSKLTAKSSVPHKIRNNLGAAAQFIENFKHRRTVTTTMTDAFQSEAQPTALHLLLASLPKLPLVVHAWYDDLPQKALRSRSSWSMVQGVSQAEHFGNWVHYYSADGSHCPEEPSSTSTRAETLLYQPLGSVWPAQNYLVSDSDFVEVLTEIDIQTPIPPPVQELRKDRSFLFLGCRFTAQLDRMFARQIIKRSSDKHWAVLPDEPTRNEASFLKEYNIERIPVSLDNFVALIAQMQLVNY